MKRNIAAFDFDGTLTTRDSFLAFIKFACGTVSYYTGFLRFTPQLILMLLHLYPNWKAKERIFGHFFKGWQYSWFKALGEDFSAEIDTMRNEATIQRLREQRTWVSTLCWPQKWRSMRTGASRAASRQKTASGRRRWTACCKPSRTVKTTS